MALKDVFLKWPPTVGWWKLIHNCVARSLIFIFLVTLAITSSICSQTRLELHFVCLISSVTSFRMSTSMRSMAISAEIVFSTLNKCLERYVHCSSNFC